MLHLGIYPVFLEEMLAAEMSGDGGESRGSGGAIAAEQINSEWLL